MEPYTHDKDTLKLLKHLFALRVEFLEPFCVGNNAVFIGIKSVHNDFELSVSQESVVLLKSASQFVDIYHAIGSNVEVIEDFVAVEEVLVQ